MTYFSHLSARDCPRGVNELIEREVTEVRGSTSDERVTTMKAVFVIFVAIGTIFLALESGKSRELCDPHLHGTPDSTSLMYQPLHEMRKCKYGSHDRPSVVCYLHENINITCKNLVCSKITTSGPLMFAICMFVTKHTEHVSGRTSCLVETTPTGEKHFE